MSWAAVAAVVLWSSNVGVSRLVAEPLGGLLSGAAAFVLAGAIGTVVLLRGARTQKRPLLQGMSRRYLLGCGGLFVVYSICLYGAIGSAPTHRQVLEVGVINYLWPGLTLALSVPLLGKRAGALLPVGVVVAFAGVALAAWPVDARTPAAVLDALRQGAGCHLLALGAAGTWALYSNLAGRWGPKEGGAVPLFLLGGGLAMGALGAFSLTHPQWSWNVALPLLFLALGPGLAAYLLWERAMRSGRVAWSASVAHLIPILSTLLSSVLLRVPPAPGVWAGAVLVVLGALLCRRGVAEREER